MGCATMRWTLHNAGWSRVAATLAGALAWSFAAAAPHADSAWWQISAALDYTPHGTQPGLAHAFVSSDNCAGCHASTDNNDPAEEGSTGFGLTLQNLTPQIARRLQIPSGRTGALISDVDPNGPSAAALRQFDLILSVNRKPVMNAAEAGRELQKIAAGHIAQILVWRGESEVFVTVKKD